MIQSDGISVGEQKSHGYFRAHIHHVHVFSVNIDVAVFWWKTVLGGKVIFDGDFGGSRNVFMKLGGGRIHFYDQRPRDDAKGAIHHIGIRVNGLENLVKKLVEKKIPLRNNIREFGNWRYIMCPAPDNILLELFEIDINGMPLALAEYFDDETNY